MLAALDAPDEIHDVVIIGGGATGLGAALESAARGHRTVLLERRDFASGTSSRSTKLIHGGLRYLAQGQVGMVRQSLVERERLLKNAPGLVTRRDFFLPARSCISQCVNFAGLRLYDALAGHVFSGRSRWCSPATVARLMPALQASGIRGGVLYGDAQFDDARLAIALARTAVQHGTVVLNGMPVVAIHSDRSGIRIITARDSETGREYQIRAKVVVNASGVFAEQVAALERSDASHSSSSRAAGKSRHGLVLSQGSHIVLDKSFLPGTCALIVPRTSDGRVLFLIPWLDRVLVGTTDIRVDAVADEPRPQAAEVEFLLKHAAQYLTRAPQESDVLSRFAGLRPLAGSGAPGQTTSRISREHSITVGDNGLITVIGGKWTTYRRMGEELVDIAERVGGLVRRASPTRGLRLTDAPLPSASNTSPGESPWLAESPLLHPGLQYREADVEHAVKFEMARSVEDVLARRTRILFLDARAAEACAPRVAEILGRELGRTADWIHGQVAAFRQLAAGY
jgi:glycerol-3-phosphate dehydrogenase